MEKIFVTKVKMNEIIDAIELTDDVFSYYLDTKTGKCIPYAGSSGIDLGNNLEEELEMNPDRYIRLPSREDINEYGIMEEFIWSLPDGEQKDKLKKDISGRGAFRKFKDRILEYDLREKWFEYQRESFIRIATEWCEYNELEYL